MKRALFAALLLAGCATTPAPPRPQVGAGRLQQGGVTGMTPKAPRLATFGPTKSVVFDSGYETWVYQSPAGNGRHSEFVVLINPAGVVTRTRTRPPG